jgi:hypothetical protein
MNTEPEGMDLDEALDQEDEVFMIGPVAYTITSSTTFRSQLVSRAQ